MLGWIPAAFSRSAGSFSRKAAGKPAYTSVRFFEKQIKRDIAMTLRILPMSLSCQLERFFSGPLAGSISINFNASSSLENNNSQIITTYTITVIMKPSILSFSLLPDAIFQDKLNQRKHLYTKTKQKQHGKNWYDHRKGKPNEITTATSRKNQSKLETKTLIITCHALD